MIKNKILKRIEISILILWNLFHTYKEKFQKIEAALRQPDLATYDALTKAKQDLLDVINLTEDLVRIKRKPLAQTEKLDIESEQPKIILKTENPQPKLSQKPEKKSPTNKIWRRTRNWTTCLKSKRKTKNGGRGWIDHNSEIFKNPSNWYWGSKKYEKTKNSCDQISK